jgi:hypothetical protein
VQIKEDLRIRGGEICIIKSKIEKTDGLLMGFSFQKRKIIYSKSST